MRHLYKLFLALAALAILFCLSLPKAQAASCKKVFYDAKASRELTPPAFRSLMDKIRLAPQSKKIKIGRHWNISNLFGYFEIVISEHPRGIQFAIISKGIENPSTLKKLSQILLSHYFGTKNVTYPRRPDGEVSEHLMIDTSHGQWTRLDIQQRLQSIERNFNELPSRVTTSPEIIRSNPEVVQDLVDFGKLHFPYMSSGKFIQRVSTLIPYFVQKQPNHKNYSFHPDIFSTREISGDLQLTGFLKLLFNYDVNVKEIREELRQEFIAEFNRELQELYVYRKRMEAWEALRERPDAEDRSSHGFILLPTTARRNLPKKYKLRTREYNTLSHFGFAEKSSNSKIMVFMPQNTPRLASETNTNLSTSNSSGSIFIKTENSNSITPGQVSGTGLENPLNMPVIQQGRDPLIASPSIGRDVQFESLARELGIDTFYDAPIKSTDINQLVVSSNISQKIRTLPEIREIEDLARFSAQQLVEVHGFSRNEMIELLVELDAHGVHIHFDGKWDAANMKLRKSLPQYYEYKHTPQGVNWHETVPSDGFLNE